MNTLVPNLPKHYPSTSGKDNVDNGNDSIKDKTILSSPSSALETPNLQMSTNNLHCEENRLKTFNSTWPLSFIDTHVLAKTGFYYIGPYDLVKCYFCKLEVCRWEMGDNEITEHSRWSPNCPLLKRCSTSNVPLGPATELDNLLPPVSYDVCGIYGIDRRPNSYTETPFTPSINHDIAENTSLECGIQTLKHPDFPEFAIETVRLRSFDDWPKTMKQKPKQLSDAGFFYTEKGDRVICFSCGGGLRDWDEQDDPWEQHALWYSTCDYLRLVKGDEYIESVKEKFANVDKINSNDTSAATFETLVADNDKDEQNTESKTNDSRLCKICYSNEYNTAFLPCGHVIACTKCASAVSTCPLCRKPFERVMRVFLT